MRDENRFSPNIGKQYSILTAQQALSSVFMWNIFLHMTAFSGEYCYLAHFEIEKI